MSLLLVDDVSLRGPVQRYCHHVPSPSQILDDDLPQHRKERLGYSGIGPCQHSLVENRFS